ncbi:hypothetical protein GJ744_005910 [Endocarpon pusillum]|uniref:Uncharacterized protein n=1 Tax=Endocarpon pusillum TaxID=364733 RepID=A0A8H7AKI4_9EURO|nr:hypothetical protein GJ744_005910 [Endocarpon pusillum]
MPQDVVQDLAADIVFADRPSRPYLRSGSELDSFNASSGEEIKAYIEVKSRPGVLISHPYNRPHRLMLKSLHNGTAAHRSETQWS